MESAYTIEFSSKRPGPIVIRSAAAHQQIDLSDRDQVKRWCREFGTTQLHLFSTCDRVGTDINVVRNALRIR
jgi:hypothetical protein